MVDQPVPQQTTAKRVRRMPKYEAVTEALRLAAKETEHLRVSPRDRQSLEINRPPFNIKPGERYTDKQTGKTWELTDHGQWKEVHDAPE